MITVADKVHQVLPDHEARKECLSIFAETIVLADSYGSKKWGVRSVRHRGRPMIRLHVGQLIVSTLVKNEIWLPLDGDALSGDSQSKRRLDQAQAWRWDEEFPQYKPLPSNNGYLSIAEDFHDTRSVAVPLHHEFIKRMSKKYDHLDPRTQRGHSHAVVRYIAEELNIDLPTPGYLSDDSEDTSISEEITMEGVSAPATTEQRTLVDSRLGQGIFRQRLMDMWNGCCAVTHCDLPAVLRASHIKPWRDSDNQERLDPYNGLLLVANLDALFDSGYISFDDAGKVLLSGELSEELRDYLDLNANLRLRRVLPDHKPYLDYHRRKVFRS